MEAGFQGEGMSRDGGQKMGGKRFLWPWKWHRDRWECLSGNIQWDYPSGNVQVGISNGNVQVGMSKWEFCGQGGPGEFHLGSGQEPLVLPTPIPEAAPKSRNKSVGSGGVGILGRGFEMSGIFSRKTVLKGGTFHAGMIPRLLWL